MKKTQIISTAVLAFAGMIAGCKSADTTPPSPGPTTAPVGQATPMAAPPMPSTMPAALPAIPLPTTAIPGAKDLTHELTKDQPLFASEPGPSDTPGGTIKAGSKVLVVIPGATYSQVVTDQGISAYTATEGLKPVGK